MASSRTGGSGGGASDSDSDNELDLDVQEAIDRLLRQRRRRYLARSITDVMYPGTTLLHIFGCMRTTLLRSRVLGMPYSADVLGCIVLCLCISLVH